jgi:hypothetical protein
MVQGMQRQMSTLYYELADHKIWLPVPCGYEVPVDWTEDDEDDPFK